MESAIPKTIHYCWFGGNPLGSKELKCIESWKQFFPEYKIVRWDESNFDVRCCPYVSQAYDAKKWAFVSDYARFAILYKHGGIYFDTDVEVIRPMDDIVRRGPFMGFESDATGSGNNYSVAPGLGLSASPGLDLYKSILASYETDEFVKADGSLNQTTVVVRTTDIMRSFGLRDVPGIQEVGGVIVYPSEYFNPKDLYTGEIHLTNKTRAIHHFAMSWFSKRKKFEYDITSWVVKRGLSLRVAGRIACLVEIVRYCDIRRARMLLNKWIFKSNKK